MSMPNNRLPFKQIGKSSLIRPRFSPGLLLQDDDLTAVVDYGRDMTRLLFRSMLGCGVLCGFEVKAKFDACANLQILVQAGVALDCRGDLIEFPKDQTLEIDPECCKSLPSPLWVVIGHKQHSCAPRDVASSPEDDENGASFTRIREGYELRVLAEQPMEACSCVDANGESPGNCYASHEAGQCACSCDCDAVVLARILLVDPGKGDIYEQEVDHSVRRFVRPQLMPDPLVQRARKMPDRKPEQKPDAKPTEEPAPAEKPTTAEKPAPAPTERPSRGKATSGKSDSPPIIDNASPTGGEVA